MQQFKIRCSAIGEIMAGNIGLTESQRVELSDYISRETGTHPKGLKLTDNMRANMASLIHKRDNPELPQTAKSYAEKWLKERIYGRKKEIGSKYLDKGTEMELQAIVMACDHFGWGFVPKNDISLDNDDITGTPDIILRDRPVDIKCPWDCFTFPLFSESIPNDHYWWQLQGYMDITGLDKAQLVYCLMDAPENLIDAEARRVSFSMGYDEVDAMLYEEVKSDMTYSGLPESLRIRSWEFERDDEAISSIHFRVGMIRKYIDELVTKYSITITA